MKRYKNSLIIVVVCFALFGIFILWGRTILIEGDVTGYYEVTYYPNDNKAVITVHSDNAETFFIALERAVMEIKNHNKGRKIVGFLPTKVEGSAHRRTLNLAQRGHLTKVPLFFIYGRII